MATFLVTSKMPPALAERVEASVRGRKRTARPRWLRSMARAGLVLALAGGVASLVAQHRRARSDFERVRASLLEEARTEAAQVTDEDRQSIERVESWLARLAGAFEGDRVAVPWVEVQQALLVRPAVYVRGARSAFASPAGMAQAEHESMKDALLHCLVDPPASRTEKLVLAKVRAAHAPDAAATAHVQRVDDARAGLPFFSPPWLESIAAAPTLHEVDVLRARFEKAHVARTRDALHAEVLLAVMDETESGTGPTEIDGARAHDVRFAIVDLRANAIAVSFRRHMDPSWISMELRPRYASELDSCALALELRENLAVPRPMR